MPEPEAPDPARPRQRVFTKRRVVLALVSLALTVTLVELALRMFWRDPQQGVLDGMVVADGDVGYRVAPGFTGVQEVAPLKTTITTNSRGYRNREVAPKSTGVRRLVVLGDSFAFGHCVDVEAAFPNQIEKRLAEAGQAVEVVNVSAPGYATKHEFRILAADGRSLAADDVIVAFYVGNDFLGNYEPKAGELTVDWGRLVARMPGTGVIDQVKTWLMAHFKIALLISRAFRERAAPSEADAVRYVCSQADWDSAFSLAVLRRVWSADAEGAWQDTQLWLKAIQGQCGELGARLHVALLPGPQQYSKEIWGLTCQLCGLDPKDFDLERPNRELRAWCEANSVHVIDLLPAFVASNDDASNRLFLDCHFSVAGHLLAARVIADALAR
jgi:hypothetical protein